MDRRQKSILARFLTVIAATAIAVVGLFNFKDWVNRSEALQAMQSISTKVAEYREKISIIPPEAYIAKLKDEVKEEGGVRLGRLQYRGLFIEPQAEPNEILLYSEKKYPSSFLEDGYIVLFLDGTVKWMPVEKFKELLVRQQTDFEIHMLEH